MIFSKTFHGRFDFQGLFKKALYIQAIFKPVQTLQKCPLVEGENTVQYLYNTPCYSIDLDITQIFIPQPFTKKY